MGLVPLGFVLSVTTVVVVGGVVVGGVVVCGSVVVGATVVVASDVVVVVADIVVVGASVVGEATTPTVEMGVSCFVTGFELGNATEVFSIDGCAFVVGEGPIPSEIIPDLLKDGGVSTDGVVDGVVVVSGILVS